VPEPSGFLTDTQALAAGKVTISTISYDLNQPKSLDVLKSAMVGNNSSG
jgi:hypothetical protein